MPFNLTTFFSWRFYPEGQYEWLALGVVIDNQRNIYTAGHEGISKHSPDGQLLWLYSKGLSFPTVPCLEGQSLFGSAHQGLVFAVDLETGGELWRTKVSDEIACDTGFVTSQDGLIVAAADSYWWTHNKQVVALNASTGQQVWSFRPDAPVWNFMALYPGDGTVVFQDLEGRAYRLELDSGLQLWKAGGFPGTWTDATLMVGPNGAVYSKSTMGSAEWCLNFLLKKHACPGVITAHRLDDGRQMWRRNFSMPTNSFTAVGRVKGVDGLAVVAPIGQQGGPPLVLVAAFVAAACLMLGLAACLLFGSAHALRSRCSGCGRTRSWACRGFALGSLVLLPPGLLTLAVVPVHEAHLYALDAETGETRWRYELPSWRAWHTAGDPEGLVARIGRGYRNRRILPRPLCLPNPFSAPTISADGGVYLGYQDGRMYSVRDSNEDGRIDGDAEVSTFSTGTAFSASGAAFAPGMMAIANCDGTFVFQQ